VLEAQLAAYRHRIEQLFASHPDHDLFGSLPGAGLKLGPRLLSEIGSDRALYEDASGLQCVAGTAPVSYQSGQVHRVRLRRACNLNLRLAMHLFADKSRARCTWADTYYDALRKRGQTHARALRCLGQRSLKISWKMWQTHTAYDEPRPSSKTPARRRARRGPRAKPHGPADRRRTDFARTRPRLLE
jgi:hypothetical protein